MASPIDFITIYRPDVYDCFRSGSMSGPIETSPQQWFATCIAQEYSDIAGRHGCSIEFSATRLEEARLLWVRDTGRIDIDSDTTPDHFKQAGFLVYWLRRRGVVNFARRVKPIAGIEEQDHFLLSPNEIASFLVGFRLSLFFASKHLIDERDHIGHDLQGLTFDSSLKFDIATLLKHKNVSPHSLYLILRTLFYQLPRPLRTAPILIFQD